MENRENSDLFSHSESDLHQLMKLKRRSLKELRDILSSEVVIL